MFGPEAQTQVINILNDKAKARQEVKSFLFIYLVSLCLFEVIWVDSFTIFKIIINFNEFITI